MKTQIFLAAWAGILIPRGYPPLYWWWASLPAFVPLMIALDGCRKRHEAALLGLSCGIVAVGIAYAWLLSFIQWAGYWSIAFYLSVVLYQALYFSLFGLTFFELKGRFGRGTAVLVSPFVWAFLEYLSSFGIFGIPELLGHSEFNNPVFREAAPLLGVNFVSFLTVSFCSLIVLIAVKRGAGRKRGLALVVIFLAIVGASHFLKGRQDRVLLASRGNPVRLALIQPAIDRSWINDAARHEDVHSRYLEATRGETSGTIDLIVWPEDVFPDSGDRSSRWRYQLFNMLGKSPVEILFGAPLTAGEAEYNAAFLYSGEELMASYQKERLFPFGEYIPASMLMQPIGLFLPPKLRGAHYSPGVKTTPLGSKVGLIGASICLESLYGDIAGRRVRDGAELLVNLTNDSWFMGSSAAEKHFFVGAMRALENGRYFVQSALYGVTGVVDPEGRVVARTGPEEVKTLEVTVYPIKMKTWFTRIGLWRFPIFALMTAIYLGISSLATRRSRSVTRS